MTTIVQTTYRPQLAPGAEGLIVDETSSSVNTLQVETAAGIGFGRAVSQGTGDTGCILGGSAFLGITVRDVTLDRLPIDPLAAVGTLLAVDTYAQRQNAAVMSRGHIWVKAGGGGDTGVKAGDALFYDTTSGTFSNSASGSAASGSVTFTSQPVAGNTVTLNGTAWTFVASGASGNQVNIGLTLGDTVSRLATALEASADANTEALTYAAYPPSPGGSGQGSGAYMLQYAAEAVGTAGNAISVSTNVPGATVQGGAGGAMQGGTLSATAVTSGYWLTSAIAGQLAVVSLGIQR
jgi:hypothetical protein